MSNIEEGTPLVAEVAAPVAASNKRNLMALFGVVVLAVIASVGYVATTARSTINVAAFDSENVSYDAATNNAAEKAKIISDSTMGPFGYLTGKEMTFPVESTDGEEWHMVVTYGVGVKKVTYSEAGSIEKSVSLGSFQGIDGQANMIFADGDECVTKDGPYFGRVGLSCASENGYDGQGYTSPGYIREIQMRSSCRFVVRANTLQQCADNVKLYGTDAEREAALDSVNHVYSSA